MAHTTRNSVLSMCSLGIKRGATRRAWHCKCARLASLRAHPATTFEFAADRARVAAKAFSNGTDGAQIRAHGHDNGALLIGQIRVDFWHGSTLQQRVLQLVLEYAKS